MRVVKKNLNVNIKMIRKMVKKQYGVKVVLLKASANLKMDIATANLQIGMKMEFNQIIGNIRMIY